ncbi:hypothetical protein PHBOTO_003678 [Pseudozyma hubeiensis]|nr:hypothetical protein PHBOTO_003678 [Pseudozyma hubeiensis]
MSNPTHPSARVIETSIHISAPLATVRSVLLDFTSYPSWSSFITSIVPVASKNNVSIDDSIRVTLNPPGGSPMNMTPKVVHLDDTGFGWQGHLANISGLFDGKHLFLLSEEDVDGKKGTKLVQREEFGGVLYTPLMSWLGMGDKTRKGFEEFDASVKKRAEQVAMEGGNTE